MLRSLFITTLVCVSSLCLAQGRVSYTYDGGGNRISRYPATEEQTSVFTSSRHAPIPSREDAIHIIPNLTNGYVTVQIRSGQDNAVANYALYDLSGRLLRKDNITSKSTRIDISFLHTGSYVLAVEFENEKKTCKITK